MKLFSNSLVAGNEELTPQGHMFAIWKTDLRRPFWTGLCTFFWTWWLGKQNNISKLFQTPAWAAILEKLVCESLFPCCFYWKWHIVFLHQIKSSLHGALLHRKCRNMGCWQIHGKYRSSDGVWVLWAYSLPQTSNEYIIHKCEAMMKLYNFSNICGIKMYTTHPASFIYVYISIWLC